MTKNIQDSKSATITKNMTTPPDFGVSQWHKILDAHAANLDQKNNAYDLGFVYDTVSPEFNLVVLHGGGWESTLLARVLLRALHTREIQLRLLKSNIVPTLTFLVVNYGQLAYQQELIAAGKSLKFPSEARDSDYITDRPSKPIVLSTHYTSFYLRTQPDTFLLTGNKDHSYEVIGRNHLFAYCAKALGPDMILFGAEPVVEGTGFPDCTKEFFEALTQELYIPVKAPFLDLTLEEYNCLVDALDKTSTENFFSCYAPTPQGVGCGDCKHCTKEKAIREKFSLMRY